MRIRLLDAETIGQIAAGEVVERPLSVVKELVENALDAGATRISVSVTGGGVSEIDVVDDGGGIAPEELALALRRHATSKLAGARELGSIATLGFRGEGLASIAAVAHVTLISRRGGAEIGAAIDAHGETIGAPYGIAAPIGTRLIVRDLFANVPARREYLRSPAAEFTRIATWLASFALAYPQVAFALRHDGREVFTFGANADPASRLGHLFGRGTESRLLPVSPSGDSFATVSGYISAPGVDRPDRRLQLLFVNGRLLRTTALAGTWSAAYRTYAMVGRYPFGVLFLDVPPGDVDPNVHPTKSEVRFRYAERVAETVRRAMAAALRASATATFERSISLGPRVDQVTASPAVSVPVADALFPFEERPHGLRILAQLDATYVLATDGSALVLIDQHAAHERIVFEQLARGAGEGAHSEVLLIPHVLDLSPPEAERLDRALPALLEAGFEIEPFGERTYRLLAMPGRIALDGRTRTLDVRGFLDALDDDVRGLDARGRICASLACHSVTRAGERMSAAEMSALVERLEACENPMHCPHGRPTIVRIEADQIARFFKRL